MAEVNELYGRLYRNYGGESHQSAPISTVTSLLTVLYDLNQPHSEAMQYDLDRLLEIMESRLHGSLSTLKDAKLAYRELQIIREYGSVADMVKQQMNRAPSLSSSVLN